MEHIVEKIVVVTAYIARIQPHAQYFQIPVGCYIQYEGYPKLSKIHIFISLRKMQNTVWVHLSKESRAP
jgi:hypothetical protein